MFTTALGVFTRAERSRGGQKSHLYPLRVSQMPPTMPVTLGEGLWVCPLLGYDAGRLSPARMDWYYARS